MKKLFALMLALCLMLGCSAMAENEISWEQVAPVMEAAGITGQFYTFEQIAMAIFIPDGMAPADLPDESYIGYFVSEDGSSAVAVQYVNVEGMDLETYAAALPEVGATGIEMGILNGLPCVSYEVPANKTLNVAFTTKAGYVLEAVCGPADSDDAKTGASMILASIQAVEAE